MSKTELSRTELYQEDFCHSKRKIVQFGKLQASTFKYSTGVCGIEICNSNGAIELLPFQGQQVWRAEFLGHALTMKTMFDEPYNTRDFLSTYGGFLLHCGLSAVGNPSKEDTHPLHGELPNAPYQSASLLCGEDENGKYIALTGEYRHLIGFESGYSFSPECRLYENETMLHMTSTIHNLRHSPLEYFYLCHINFKPEDGGKLIYSAKSEDIKVHHTVPSNLSKQDTKALETYLDKLEDDVSIHNNIDSKTQTYIPEVVFTLRYKADKNGIARTMQLLPDGYAHCVMHRPSELPFGIRWISRTADEDALGMLLPATAEHMGYLHSKKNGYERFVDSMGSISFHFAAGILSPEQAFQEAEKINDTINQDK